jgi:hypothetical protein
MRSQLLCLSDYLGQNAAARTAYLPAALSRTCHDHSYELVPHQATFARSTMRRSRSS